MRVEVSNKVAVSDDSRALPEPRPSGNHSGGRVALITGVSGALGQEVARFLADRGVVVVAAARTLEAAEAAIVNLGSRHAVYPCAIDYAAPEHFPQTVDRIYRSLGQIDILINNGASADGIRDLLDDRLTAHSLHHAFAVNVIGPMLLTQAVLPEMITRRYGRVVNVSSRAASFASGPTRMGSISYRICKVALNGFTVSLAAELGNAGDFKVNSVSPGWVRSRMGGDDAPRSPEEGAIGIVAAALLGPGGPTGQFLEDGNEIGW